MLAKTTGAKGHATAEAWWSWWDDYEESYLAGPKPVYIAYGCDEGRRYSDPYQYVPPPPPPPPPPPGVEGTVAIGQVAKTGKEATYNLEVADFHNYFVGQTKLLTHDVTSREPTSAVLPGLLKR